MPRDNLPRMADFALWGQALAPGLGLEAEQFLRDYGAAIDEKWQDAVESNTLAQDIIALLDEMPSGEWAGTATELFKELERHWPDAAERKAQGLLTSARGLSAALKRLAPGTAPSGLILQL